MNQTTTITTTNMYLRNRTYVHRWHLNVYSLLALFTTPAAFVQAGPPPPPPGLINQSVVSAVPSSEPAVVAAMPQSLAGHVPNDVATMGLTPSGGLSITQQLDLAIGLPLRKHAELTSL